MKTKILILFLIFINWSVYGENLTLGDWKVEINDGTGRFIIYYQNIPLNQKEFPISTFFSLKIGSEIYHLGNDIGVQRIEKRKDKVVIVYKVLAQVLLEMEISFMDNPLVYDQKGILIRFRVDSRLDNLQEMLFRFLFYTSINQEKFQGYRLLKDPKKEIDTEIKDTIDTIVFYPFFLKSLTKPTFIHLSSWQRMEEEFMPSERAMLNFRDIRTGVWDPAITLFYDFGKISKKTNVQDVFIGLWQKPNRVYPRIKVYHPQIVTTKKKKIKVPFMIENNGDFDIDIYKIILSSPYLKTQSIRSGEKLLKGTKKQILLEGDLEKETDFLKGNIKATLWIGQKSFNQSFTIKFKVRKPKVSIKKLIKKKSREAEPLLDIKTIDAILDRINILMYFLNRAIDYGISNEIFIKLKREIDELEKKGFKKNKKP